MVVMASDIGYLNPDLIKKLQDKYTRERRARILDKCKDAALIGTIGLMVFSTGFGLFKAAQGTHAAVKKGAAKLEQKLNNIFIPKFFEIDGVKKVQWGPKTFCYDESTGNGHLWNEVNRKSDDDPNAKVLAETVLEKYGKRIVPYECK